MFSHSCYTRQQTPSSLILSGLPYAQPEAALADARLFFSQKSYNFVCNARILLPKTESMW
jgi:hypothetical protein